jgi:hypothetical protein
MKDNKYLIKDLFMEYAKKKTLQLSIKRIYYLQKDKKLNRLFINADL